MWKQEDKEFAEYNVTPMKLKRSTKVKRKFQNAGYGLGVGACGVASATFVFSVLFFLFFLFFSFLFFSKIQHPFFPFFSSPSLSRMVAAGVVGVPFTAGFSLALIPLAAAPVAGGKLVCFFCFLVLVFVRFLIFCLFFVFLSSSLPQLIFPFPLLFFFFFPRLLIEERDGSLNAKTKEDKLFVLKSSKVMISISLGKVDQCLPLLLRFQLLGGALFLLLLLLLLLLRISILLLLPLLVINLEFFLLILSFLPSLSSLLIGE